MTMCASHILSCQPRVTVTSRFVYKANRDLESIDHLFINLIRRIGLIHKCSLDSRWLKWIVQVNVLLNNCKQTISSLSLLVGTPVESLIIVYEHFGGCGGGRSIYCGFQLQTMLIVIRLLQRAVKPGYMPLSKGNTQGSA